MDLDDIPDKYQIFSELQAKHRDRLINERGYKEGGLVLDDLFDRIEANVSFGEMKNILLDIASYLIIAKQI